MNRSSAKRIAGIAIVMMGSMAGAVATADLAGAATVASLTASPATGLTDGQSVAVTGTGYPASTTIYVVECHAATQAGCDTSRLTMITSTAAGAISGNVTVHTGAIGDGTCAAGSTTCLLEASDASQTAGGSTTLSFAAAAAASPSAAASASPSASATAAASASPSAAATAAASAAPTVAATTDATTTAAPVAVAAGTGGTADRHDGLGDVSIALIAIGGLGLGATGMRLAKSRR